MEVIAEYKRNPPASPETKSLQQYRPELHSPKPQKKENGEIELSLYEGNLVTESDLNKSLQRLSIAFPRMTPQFFALLTEFIIKDRFTTKRLEDAVNHIIMNFAYKELNISDIIRFDRRARLYTYDELYEMKRMIPHPDYERREIEGRAYYIKKSDCL